MAATYLVTLKLVGYTEIVHTLLPTGCRPTARSCCSAGWPRTGPTRARRPSRPSTAASAAWCTRWRCELAPDPGQRAAPGHRRRQPVLVRQGRGHGRGAGPHAHRSQRRDGRHRRRGGLPDPEPVRQRDRPVRRRRVAAAMNVAVIGTGRMGAAMVGRFRGAGFPVVVHNRTRSKARAGRRRARLLGRGQTPGGGRRRRRGGRVAGRRRRGARGVRRCGRGPGRAAGRRGGLRDQHRRPGHRARDSPTGSAAPAPHCSTPRSPAASRPSRRAAWW